MRGNDDEKEDIFMSDSPPSRHSATKMPLNVLFAGPSRLRVHIDFALPTSNSPPIRELLHESCSFPILAKHAQSDPLTILCFLHRWR